MAWKGYDPNASKQQKITVSYSEFASAITNYIYCVRIEDLDTDFVDELLSTGLDLKVYDSTGTECKRWLDDTFDKGTYHGFLWWVSYASDIADNDFYLYAGSGSTTANDSECWTDAGYITRHTLNESSGSAIDSCGNYDGVNTDVTYSDAASFDDGYRPYSANSEINFGNVTELNSTDEFTIEYYANLDTNVDFSGHIIKGASNNDCVKIYPGNNRYWVTVSNGAFAYGAVMEDLPAGSGSYRYTVVYNGKGATDADRLKIYWNDINKSLTFPGASMPSITGAMAGEDLTWLYHDYNTAYANGVFDELRLCSEKKESYYVDAAYSMESDLENWWTIGSVDSAPTGDSPTDNLHDGRVFRRHKRIMRASMSKKRKWNRR